MDVFLKITGLTLLKSEAQPSHAYNSERVAEQVSPTKIHVVRSESNATATSALPDFNAYKFFVFSGASYVRTSLLKFETPNKIAVAGVSCELSHEPCVKEHLDDHVCPTPYFLKTDWMAARLSNLTECYTLSMATVQTSQDGNMAIKFMGEFVGGWTTPPNLQHGKLYKPVNS